MIAAFKDWLPITKRNRVALGFAFAALVIFVGWNLLPLDYNEGCFPIDEISAMTIWPEVFSLRSYVNVFRSPDFDGFREVAACFSLMLSGLIVLVIVPLWRIFHVSSYVRIPLAVFNLAGGSVIIGYVLQYGIQSDDLMWAIIFILMGLSMFLLSVALFVFKNELGLRHQQDVKKTMGGGGSR